MDKATQKAKIIQYCAEHGSITIREAFTKLNINSPSKRISEIRNSREYIVDSITEESTEDGATTRWKRYFIRKVDDAS